MTVSIQEVARTGDWWIHQCIALLHLVSGLRLFLISPPKCFGFRQWIYFHNFQNHNQSVIGNNNTACEATLDVDVMGSNVF